MKNDVNEAMNEASHCVYHANTFSMLPISSSYKETKTAVCTFGGAKFEMKT